MKQSGSTFITRSWYEGAVWLYLLFPLALLYLVVISIRKLCYRCKILSSYKSTVPVVVVGNITLGGTGKSPLVACLVSSLKQRGFNPGVVSRGYGAKLGKHELREVLVSSTAAEVGDEPLMLKLKVDCPIFVCPNRRLAVQALENKGCDIIITDDGLQHYALQRDIEICVFDGNRRVGNGFILPMGPLRELTRRMASVDYVVINGNACENDVLFGGAIRMSLQPGELCSLATNQTCSLDALPQKEVNAVAAIGNPERFFKLLESHHFNVIRHAYDDHHAFEVSDLEYDNDFPIIMTEKDAVKCRAFDIDNAWFLPVSARLSRDLVSEIIDALD
jgi:tetraacyldisaccharide 4'-kinase